MSHSLLVFAFVLAAFPAPASEPDPVLTLEAAMERALRDSDDLTSARAAVSRSEAGRQRAVAAMLPAIAASAQYSLDRVIDTEHSAEADSRSWSAGGSVSMTLFDGRALQALQVTGLLISASTHQLRDLQQAVLLNVASAYFAALAAGEMVGVAESSVSSRQTHVRSAEARLEAGHAVRVDVERSRAALLRAERDLIDARHQLAESYDGLALALGAEPPLRHSLTAPAAFAGPIPDEGSAMDEAYRSRTDLLALRAQLEAAERSKLGTWLTFLPSLGVSGTVGVADNAVRSPEQVALGLTLNFTWTLYDGGMRYAQLVEDDAGIADLRAVLRRQSRLVRAAVRGALRDLSRAKAALAAAGGEVLAADRALAAATAAFREGTGIGLDVLDAQLALDQARAAQIREELQRDTSHASLRRALGSLR